MEKILLLVVLPFMFTSCFVTRYVSDERNWQNKLTGLQEEDVRFELGEPEEITEYQNGGYAYTYWLRGINGTSLVDQYIRVSFTDENIVKRVRSTTTTKRKRINIVGTIFTAVGVPIIVIIAVFNVSHK